jgi:hypothetical protein
VTAMSAIRFANGTPLSHLRELIWDPPQEMRQDRFFAWADATLVDQVSQAATQGVFAPEPGTVLFHPGATRKWRQVQFAEANLVLTFHEGQRRVVNGQDSVIVEPGFDYYKDPAAHAILEVISNPISQSLTDPRQAYVLRWIEGRRFGEDSFEPPYILE